jgi:hypothetical protein
MAESGDPTLKVRVEGDISNLEGKLKEAEKVVEKSGNNMGQSVDKNISAVADKLGRRIAKMIGAGFAIKTLDDALNTIADGIRNGKGADEIALAIGDSILDGLRKVPVAGALGDILAMVFDTAFGGPEQMKKARENYAEAQLRGQERARLLSDIKFQGATPEEAIGLKAEREIADLQKKMDLALSTITQSRRIFMEADFQKAVDRYLDNFQVGMGSARRGLTQEERAEARKQVEATMDREPFYQVGMGYSADEQAEADKIRQAFDKSKAEIERRAAEDLAKLREKESRVTESVAAAVREEPLPTESDVETAVRDLEDEMEMQGTDTSIFEGKLLTYAQDQLTELKSIAATLDRMSRREVGLN